MNHTLNIRNQVCREQQIQQTKADVGRNKRQERSQVEEPKQK